MLPTCSGFTNLSPEHKLDLYKAFCTRHHGIREVKRDPRGGQGCRVGMGSMPSMSLTCGGDIVHVRTRLFDLCDELQILAIVFHC